MIPPQAELMTAKSNTTARIKPYYEHGGITIYHGDCLSVLPTLSPKSVGLVLTDPPYNAGFDYGSGVNDRRPWPEYRQEIAGVIGECERVCDGPVMVFLSVTGMIEVIREKPPVWVAGWNRNGASKQVGNRGFYPSWEPCLIYGKTWIDSGRVPPWAMRDMWKSGPAPRNGHPCPKPESVIKQIISRFRSVTLLDPYMGSGTMMRVAKDCGLEAIGIEINERYCEIATKRLAQEVFRW